MSGLACPECGKTWGHTPDCSEKKQAKAAERIGNQCMLCEAVVEATDLGYNQLMERAHVCNLCMKEMVREQLYRSVPRRAVEEPAPTSVDREAEIIRATERSYAACLQLCERILFSAAYGKGNAEQRAVEVAAQKFLLDALKENR